MPAGSSALPTASGAPHLRIVVHVGGASPELARLLADTPARARAERLRQLALLGIGFLRARPIPATDPAPSGAETHGARERVLRSLIRDLDAGDAGPG